MVMTMTRNYQANPAIYPEEQEQFGIYIPKVPRASLSPSQRNAKKQPSAKIGHTAATAQTSSTTEELEGNFPQTNPPGKWRRRVQRHHPSMNQPRQGNRQYMAQRPDIRRILLVGIVIGIALLVALYTLVFLIVLVCINLSNTWNYGPTHTSYTQATINGTSDTIQTSNQNGTIYVTIINNQDGSSHTYTGPKLDPAAWNGDMNSIVATASVKSQTTITVHLIGNISYFRLFFVRPEMQFSLVANGQSGYNVVSP